MIEGHSFRHRSVFDGRVSSVSIHFERFTLLSRMSAIVLCDLELFEPSILKIRILWVN